MSILIVVLVCALLTSLAALVVKMRESSVWRHAAEERQKEADAAKLEAARLEALVSAQRETEQRLGDRFRTLSQEVLQTANEAFLQLARTELEKQQQSAQGSLDLRKQEIESLVKPIGETLQRFDQQVREIEKAREGAYVNIRTHVQDLLASQQQLRQSTEQLKTALRNPAQRGRWGEIQLRRVIEMADMTKHCDFQEQVSLAGESIQRPDLLVTLPGKRRIVVDSKVPLEGYLAAFEATDEVVRTERLNAHAHQVRTHIKQLGAKAYWDRLGFTPEFVVAFLPGEFILSAAFEREPALFEYAFSQNVLLATPTTLIALLRTIAHGWRQEELAKNADEIRQLGKTLYERLATMHGHFTKLGGSLERAVESYNLSVSAMERKVFPAARKFRDLKVVSIEDMQETEPIDKTPRALGAADWKVQGLPESAVAGRQ